MKTKRVQRREIRTGVVIGGRRGLLDFTRSYIDNEFEELQIERPALLAALNGAVRVLTTFVFTMQTLFGPTAI